MKFKSFLAQCLDDSTYLNKRFTYSHDQFPQYGIGLRFELEGHTLVPQRLFLLAQDGNKRITDADDVNVLLNVNDIPLPILELGCQVLRRVERWMQDSELDLSALHVDQQQVTTKEWDYEAK